MLKRNVKCLQPNEGVLKSGGFKNVSTFNAIMTKDAPVVNRGTSTGSAYKRRAHSRVARRARADNALDEIAAGTGLLFRGRRCGVARRDGAHERQLQTLEERIGEQSERIEKLKRPVRQTGEQ